MIINYPLQLFDELGKAFMPESEEIEGVNINEGSFADDVYREGNIEWLCGDTNRREIIVDDLLIVCSVWLNCEKKHVILDWIEAYYDEKPIDVHIDNGEFEWEMEKLLIGE